MKKLVRDKMPDIFKAEGKDAQIAPVMSPDAFEWYVKQKLSEELTEVLEAVSVEDITEELGDLLEVIRKYASIKGVTWLKLEQTRMAKAREKGYFDKGLILTLEEK